MLKTGCGLQPVQLIEDLAGWGGLATSWECIWQKRNSRAQPFRAYESQRDQGSMWDFRPKFLEEVLPNHPVGVRRLPLCFQSKAECLPRCLGCDILFGRGWVYTHACAHTHTHTHTHTQKQISTPYTTDLSYLFACFPDQCGIHFLNVGTLSFISSIHLCASHMEGTQQMFLE